MHSVIFDQGCWLPKEGLAQPFLTRLKLDSPIGRNLVNGQPPILELLFDALSLNVSWSISVGFLSGLDFGLAFQVVLLLLLPSFLGLAQFGWATTDLLLFIRLLVGIGTCGNSCRIKLVANAFNLRKEVSSVSSEPKTNEPYEVERLLSRKIFRFVTINQGPISLQKQLLSRNQVKFVSKRNIA